MHVLEGGELHEATLHVQVRMKGGNDLGQTFHTYLCFRHLDVGDKKRNVTPCFFEAQPGGCRKPHCPFLHDRPKGPYPGEVLEGGAADGAAPGPAKGTIIVNKSRMEELSGLILPVRPGTAKVSPPTARVPPHRRLGPRPALAGLSVKDRLGYKTPTASAAADGENVEVFEFSSSDEGGDTTEEEALRASAIKTIDLRKRLDITRRSTEEGDEVDREDKDDEAFREEYRKGELKALAVVRKEKKKDKKDKKEKKKKKDKKEKKAAKKAAKEGKALREIKLDENEMTAEVSSRRIITRLGSPPPKEEGGGDGDSASLSLADKVAAMRDGQFATNDGDKLSSSSRLGARPEPEGEERGPRRSPSPVEEEEMKMRKRKRRRDGEEGEGKAKSKKSKKRRSDEGEEGSPKKKKKSKEVKKDMDEVEKFLKEDPEVNAAANSSMDVMKELDELLQE